MLNSSDTPMDCNDCRTAIEESLQGGAIEFVPGARVQSHLAECAECGDALESAKLSSKFMRVARETAPEPSEWFVTRVMAAVREAAEGEEVRTNIWRALELLASRFAMIAAALLLVLSLYLAEFAPARPARMVSSQTDIGSGLPEPPAQPANQDEVLMSLSELPNGN